MNQYTINLPVEIQFASPLNSVEFSSDMEIDYHVQTLLSGITITVTVTGKTGTICLNGIEASNEQGALENAIPILSVVSNLVSVDFNFQNENSHYGHPRLSWSPHSITISPRDHMINDALGISMHHEMKPVVFESALGNSISNPQLTSLLSSVSASFLSADYRTKFYHAFTVFEYLEQNHTSNIPKTSLLNANEVSSIVNAVAEAIKTRDPEVITRIKSATKGAISNLTTENRAEKLKSILNDYLSITAVVYAGQEKKIDLDYCSTMIDMRNRLFHGKTAVTDPQIVENDFKINTDIAIIVAVKSFIKLVYLYSMPQPAVTNA